MTRNLAERSSDGISVSLDFDTETQEISVAVKSATDDFRMREVPHPMALEVFHHPYAFAGYLLTAGTYNSGSDS